MAIRNIADVLEPHGVLFGGTVLGLEAAAPTNVSVPRESVACRRQSQIDDRRPSI